MADFGDGFHDRDGDSRAGTKKKRAASSKAETSNKRQKKTVAPQSPPFIACSSIPVARPVYNCSFASSFSAACPAPSSLTSIVSSSFSLRPLTGATPSTPFAAGSNAAFNVGTIAAGQPTLLASSSLAQELAAPMNPVPSIQLNSAFWPVEPAAVGAVPLAAAAAAAPLLPAATTPQLQQPLFVDSPSTASSLMFMQPQPQPQLQQLQPQQFLFDLSSQLMATQAPLLQPPILHSHGASSTPSLGPSPSSPQPLLAPKLGPPSPSSTISLSRAPAPLAAPAASDPFSSPSVTTATSLGDVLAFTPKTTASSFPETVLDPHDLLSRLSTTAMNYLVLFLDLPALTAMECTSSRFQAIFRSHEYDGVWFAMLKNYVDLTERARQKAVRKHTRAQHQLLQQQPLHVRHPAIWYSTAHFVWRQLVMLSRTLFKGLPLPSLLRDLWTNHLFGADYPVCNDLELLIQPIPGESNALWFATERGPDGEVTEFGFSPDLALSSLRSSVGMGGNNNNNNGEPQPDQGPVLYKYQHQQTEQLEQSRIVIETTSASGEVRSLWQPDLACFIYWFIAKRQEVPGEVNDWLQRRGYSIDAIKSRVRGLGRAVN